MSETRRYGLALAVTLVAAWSIRVLVAYAMPNQVWPDEIFQTLEPAHRAVFGTGIVPWEYRVGVRSWLLPGMLAGVMEVTSWLTSSAVAYLVACASVLSVISLAPIWAGMRTAYRDYGLRAAVVAGVFVTLWFELVYFAPKALYEVVAGNCFALGVVLAQSIFRSNEDRSLRWVALTAGLLALSAVLRIQLSIAALVAFGAVFWRVDKRARIVSLAVGAGVVLFAGLVDAITWTYPFQSFVENVRINIVEGRSAKYGTAPWYAFFEVFARTWSFWGLGIVALAAFGARRAPLLAICAGIALVTHIPIAHKEYRFAYPALALVIVLASLGAAALVKLIEERRDVRAATLAAIGLVVVWFAASASGASRYHGERTQLAGILGREQGQWVRRRGGMVALRELGEDPATCGVGLAGVGWMNTGGYSYLHRDIPVYMFFDQRGLARGTLQVNRLLAPAGRPERIGPYIRTACWEDVCSYAREGDCTPIPGYDINDVLITLDQ